MKTEQYTLFHEDTELLTFSLEYREVVACEIKKDAGFYLPLPLKRILHFKEEFLAGENTENLVLNEEGCALINNWLSDREIPSDRNNYHKYIRKRESPLTWMLENYAYAFTDNYWINREDEPKTYTDILTMKASVDRFFTVTVGKEHFYSGVNATLGGQLEKYWYRSNGQLKLCKKVERNFDVLNARECVASYIYRLQGFPNYCEYDFVKDAQGDVVGCKCKAFTSESTELITSFDLLEEYNLTQQPDVYEQIPMLAEKLGVKKEDVLRQMDLETLVDFLILNRDRHQGNIGFLRDSKTLQIKAMAPIFDSGSCKFLEAEKPESVENTTINGLYPTEQELLLHVTDFSVLDIERLPPASDLRPFYDACGFLSEYRKNQILDLYEKKKVYLAQLQQQKKQVPIDQTDSFEHAE